MFLASRYLSMAYGNDDHDLDDEREEIEEDQDADSDESDEDTEEASETEIRRSESSLEVAEMREQYYKEKLDSLKTVLQELNKGTYPDYNRKLKRLENQYKERLRLNSSWREHLIELMEKDFVAEKRAAAKELEEKVIELKENLVQDMEEKRKLIESERTSMELSGDSTETKPAITRKLRRRPNDPAPLPEKRRGKIASLPSQINFLLDDKEIDSDLKAISRGMKTGPSVRKPGFIEGNRFTLRGRISRNSLQ